MTDTPMGSGHDPAEPTHPEPTEPRTVPTEALDPPVPAGGPTDPEPTGPEPTAAATPAGETPTAPTAAAAPTAEIPATPAPTAPVTATPVTATTVVEEPARRRGVMVPWWALAVVAALVVFGGGYLIGQAVGDDGGSGTSARFVRPGGGAFGGNQIPSFPNGGNGNFGPFGGNDGGNGNGNGSRGNGGNGNGGNSPAVRSQAFLGVGVANTANGGGARITTVVSSGPAAGAGITRGDVITAIDGTKVTDVATLRSAIAAHEPGDSVKVTYTRDGAEKTADATLGDRNATSQ